MNLKNKIVSVDLWPFSCHIDNTVALQITIIAIGITLFILHVSISKLLKTSKPSVTKYHNIKRNDKDDEEEEEDQ